MKNLIEALNIFLKYANEDYPTHCEHDVLWIVGVTEDQVTEEDKVRLIELGFFYSYNDNSWQSYKYGSA